MVVLLIAVFFFLVARSHTVSLSDGWDPLAYQYAAERLAEGGSPSFCSPYNASIGPYFTLAGFNVRSADPECLVLNYPPGFPAILAAFAKLLPVSDAMFWAPAAFGACGAIAVYWLGRLLFDVKTALLSVAMLVLVPDYLGYSTSLWSDLPVAVLLLIGTTLLVWVCSSRDVLLGAVGGVLGGCVIGLAALARYTALISLVPLAAFVYAGRARYGRSPRVAIAAFSVAIVASVAAILAYNHRFYGGFLVTPYSPVHGWYEWPMFSLRYVLGASPVGTGSLPALARTLWRNYGLFLAFAGIGIGVARGPRRLLILLSLALPLGVHAFYAFPAEGVNARFLLPAFPFLAVSIGHGVRHVLVAAGGLPRGWRVLCVVGILVSMLLPVPGILADRRSRNAAVAGHVAAMVGVAQMTEPDAVILAYSVNDVIAYYGQRTTLFYRRVPATDTLYVDDPALTEPPLVAAVNALLARSVPVYVVQANDALPMGGKAVLSQYFTISEVDAAFHLLRLERAPTGMTAGD